MGMKNRKKVLLTGATGFLGSALQPVLEKDFEVISLGNRSCPPGGIQSDLTQHGEVERLLESVTPDIVVHTAAIREPDLCEEDPQRAKEINTLLPARFAKLLPDHARLLHISTDYVFDGTRPPYREKDEVSPINIYGITKAEAEQYVLSHPGGIVLRIPVLIGAGPGFIQQMVEALENNESQEIDDVLIRHPTWIQDVAHISAWLLSTERTGIWHASSERGETRYGCTKRVAEVLGLSWDHLSPSKAVLPRKATRPLNSNLSPKKLLQAGGPRCRELDEIVRLLYR